LLSTVPWHAWQFDVRTGESVTDDSKVVVYPCKVEGDQVLVEV
jgi:nitrite reductase/ring-hydroxylating ferredoxin subunit